MKTRDDFRDPSSPFTRSGGNPYAGTPLSVSGNLAESIQESFGINTDELSLRESPEVADMGARATAQGDVIRFAPGVFNPDTHEGLSVLGHELNHVRDQADGGVKANVTGTNIHYDAGHEAASDLVGEAFANGSLTRLSDVSLAGAEGAAVEGGWFDDIKDKAATTAGNAWDSVATTAGHAWDSVATTAGSIKDEVVSSVGNTATSAARWVNGTATGITNDISEFAAALKDNSPKVAAEIFFKFLGATHNEVDAILTWLGGNRQKEVTQSIVRLFTTNPAALAFTKNDFPDYINAAMTPAS